MDYCKLNIVALKSIGFSIVLPTLPFLMEKRLPLSQIEMSALISVLTVFILISSCFRGLNDRY